MKWKFAAWKYRADKFASGRFSGWRDVEDDATWTPSRRARTWTPRATKSRTMTVKVGLRPPRME